MHKKSITNCSASIAVDHVVERAARQLDALGYHPDTVAQKREIWGRFVDLAGDQPFSTALAERFLEHEGVPRGGERLPTKQQRKIQTAMRQLVELHLYGDFRRRGTHPDTIHLPDPLASARSSYEQFCRDRLGHRPQTLQQRRRFITHFLAFVHAQGITSVAAIDASTISMFIAQHAHFKPKTVAAVCSSLRSFLRHLCMQGQVREELRAHVPTVRVPRDSHIPAGWKQEEVDKLLEVVDRTSPRGKRDHAILLLAARLGMRAGDVRNLRLEHLHWDAARIDFVQEKTRVPQCLPMTDEIGEALVDYLRHGRPATHHREVFLRLTPPIAPFAASNCLYEIVTTYRRVAQIEIPSGRAGGMHAFRHALATRLLEGGTALETISHVMGHVTPTSTLIYAKVGVEDLRGVALEWEASHE